VRPKPPRIRTPIFDRRRLPFLSGTLLVTGGCVAFLLLRSSRETDRRSMSLTNLVQQIKSGEITDIRVADSGGVATARSGETLPFTTERDQPILNVLADLGATPADLSKISCTVIEPPPSWLGALASLIPLVLFGALLLMIMRRLGSRGGNPMQSFGHTRARLPNGTQPGVTFGDVAGVDEPLQEL
jgi:cell division protease FtsH